MKLAVDNSADSPEKAPARRRHRPAKPQLLTRDQLDGRTNAARAFAQIVTDIEIDLGGRDRLSTIERALIEAFAGACITLQHLNVKLALGEEIDLGQHAQAVSAMVRVASRLGLERRARNCTPSIEEYARHVHDCSGASA
jgi:hypothetical protein